MANEKLKKVALGTMLVGSMVACSPKQPKEGDKDEEKPETEVVTDTQTAQDDPYGNIAVFEAARSKIKFALAVVENYDPYTYIDGNGNWTTAEGLTVLYDEKGKATKVTKNTKPLTLAEYDVYKGRYLTYDVLPKVKQGFKATADENVLMAITVLGYCVGPQWIADSEFTKQFNAGKRGAELAPYLTGFCQEPGVPKRMYFLAALVAGEVQWEDFLELRAEGCYNLTWQDIFVCNKNGVPIKKKGYRQWDFTKLQNNLAKAKGPKSTVLHLKDNQTVTVECKLAKEIVPDYVWQEVSSGRHVHVPTPENTIALPDANADAQNDISYIAYQNGDYETALSAGKMALKFAETNKQRGAAHYNIGITYLAMGKYGKAVRHLELSLAENKTRAAQTALDEARQKRQSRNRKNGAYAVAIGLGIGAIAYGRKRYLNQRTGKHK